MKKTILAISLFFGSIITAYSQTYYSIVTGTYTVAANWSQISCGGAVSASAPGATVDICSGTYITFSGAMTVGPGGNIGSLTIESGGTLEITGACTFKNGAVVDVEAGGSLIVDGSFTNKNNSTGITVDGSMDVKGAASLGTGSTIVGTGTFTVSGALTGPGTVFGTDPSCTACYFSGSTLPITLTAFSAAINTENNIALSWSTATEINNKVFTIERSTDGVNWTEIAEVQGAGTTSTVHNYSSLDATPANGVNYYRLKQTDYDGNAEYVSTVAIVFNIVLPDLKVIPNPATNNCVLAFSDDKIEISSLSIYNSMGQQVLQKQVQLSNGENSLSLDVSTLTKGVYYITLPRNGSLLKVAFIKE